MASGPPITGRSLSESCSTLPVQKLSYRETGYSIFCQQSTIATTLFSSANPDNVLKNITYAEEPIDWNLVKEVQEIIGEQMRVSWANS